MATQTMSEKSAYLQALDREHEITRRVIEGFPASKLDFCPGETSRPARDLIWLLSLTEHVLGPVLEGELMPSPGGFPPAPQTLPELLGAFDKTHQELGPKIRAMPEEAMNDKVKMPVGPKQIGEVRRGDALWMFLNDQIHHRGQLSIYSRMTGGKVPSIYGPSKDEPWW